MSFIKRRALALAGSIVFFLTGCTVKGNTTREIEKNNSAKIDSYIEEFMPDEHEEKIEGSKVKIFAFYNPELGTVHYSILEATGRDETYSWPCGRDIVEKAFSDVISAEELDKMHKKFHLKSTVYHSVTNDGFSGAITKINVSGKEYEFYNEYVNIVGNLNGSSYISLTSLAEATKNGEKIKESVSNHINFGEHENVKEYNFVEEMEFAPACYIPLNEDTLYSKSQLKHLQDSLNNISLGTKKVIDNDEEIKLQLSKKK